MYWLSSTIAFLAISIKWFDPTISVIIRLVRAYVKDARMIRKYVRAGTVKPAFAVPERPSKLDPYAEKLSGWLRTEAGRSRKQRRTSKQRHTDLVTLGDPCSYGRVAVLAGAWKAARQQDAQISGRGGSVPLAFAAGDAFQFDWSEDWAVLRGDRTKLRVAHTKLSHSRAFIVRAYLIQTHEMLFDALTQAFRVLGGVPRRGILDNMRTALIASARAKRGRSRPCLQQWPAITSSSRSFVIPLAARRRARSRRTSRMRVGVHGSRCRASPTLPG